MGLLLEHAVVVAAVFKGKADGKELVVMPFEGPSPVGEHGDLRLFLRKLLTHGGEEGRHIVKECVAVSDEKDLHFCSFLLTKKYNDYA